MRLEKWYGDFVGPTGADIAYLANLRIGPSVIGFEGGYSAGAPKSSFRPYAHGLPTVTGGTLSWGEGPGGRAWQGARSRPFRLVDGGRGVTWDPVVLDGEVSGPGVPPGQRGYAERIVLEIPPWALGLRELRWGRFRGGGRSLVWIRWEGETPLRLVLLDGVPVPGGGMDGAHVAFEGGALEWDAAAPFVDEPLSSGILRALPLPRRIRPVAFLDGRETKFAGAARLRVGPVSLQGDVIHEVVTWA